MTQNSVCIFWDESHIWGIMAWRAIRAFGLSCRLVKSTEISQGGLLGKGVTILVVPGGGARLKSAVLGPAGREAIRHWLARGGTYIGFCGGAGLALKQKREAEGLGICSWNRGEYASRLFHLLSGHVNARVNGKICPLPIWWPGRFAPGDEKEISVLARYESPARDLWLADLPLSEMPPMVRKIWRQQAGFNAENIFPPGQPLVIEGNYGKGRYLLSYAHLETPQSPAANGWLAEILSAISGIEIKMSGIPVWNCMPDTEEGENFAYPKELPTATTMEESLQVAYFRIAGLLCKGMNLGLFFRRNSWLLGWRPGLAGMACNNMLALLHTLVKIPPTNSQLAIWHQSGGKFNRLLDLFIARAEDTFWNIRLEKTLERENVFDGIKNDTRKNAEIFGHPMLGGGIAGQILKILEEMVWLGQEEMNKYDV